MNKNITCIALWGILSSLMGFPILTKISEVSFKNLLIVIIGAAIIIIIQDKREKN